MNDNLGKDAEKRIRQWLDRPEDGYCLDRIPDQMTGKFGSKNICDFILFKYPEFYYIESKATWEDRFDFVRIDPFQKEKLLEKSKIDHVHGLIIVLFATYKRAFILDINDVENSIQHGVKSINIKKIDRWLIPYQEIITIPNNRKHLLDYRNEENVL